jgi:N-acetylglutamate synthase-like GNAT family acetyltransferase
MANSQPEQLTLRRTDEFEKIRELAVGSGLEDGPLENVAEAFGFYLGGELVGCATLKVDGQKHSVEWLAVRDGMRLHGLGAQLVREVEAAARRRGATRLWALARAPEFFQRIGFSRAPENDPGRPPMVSCTTCKQFGRTCHPEMMVKQL